MSRSTAFVQTLLALVAVTSMALAQDLPDLTIEAPRDGDEVAMNQPAEGRLADTSLEVWSIVRPRGTATCWATPMTPFDPSGWNGIIPFGAAGTPRGTEFDVQIIAEPLEVLERGPVECWPAATWRTRLITVTRG